MEPQVFHEAGEVARFSSHVVFACGAFDGVHRGHAAVFAKARAVRDAWRCAGHADARLFALTFEPHPLAVLAPARAPALLTTLKQRLGPFAEAGADGVLALPFTQDFAALSPEDFLRETFAPWSGPGAAVTLVSGPDWRFGRGGAGRPADVAALTGGRICAETADAVLWRGAPISSSRIREAVRTGDMRGTAAMLGRPYALEGRTMAAPDRGVGTALGAPTANLVPDAAVLPPCGVYVVEVRIAGEGLWRRGVADYGFRPTFADARPAAPILEVHVLDWAGGALYGTHLDVRVLDRIRDERVFPSAEALASRIREDIAIARSWEGDAP